MFIVQPAHRPVLNTGDLRQIVLLSGPTPIEFRDTLYAGPPRTGSSDAEFLVPVPLWATCSDGTVVVFEPPDRLISIRPALGTADTIDLPLLGRRIEEGDIRRFLRHSMEVELIGRPRPPDEVIERRINQVVRRGREMFGTEAPSATSLLCDDRGNVWIQGFDTEEHPVGFGRDWWIVDTGHIVATVRFPRGFQPRAIHRFGVVGTRRDALDVERLFYVPAEVVFDQVFLSTDASPASVDTMYPRPSQQNGERP